MNGQSRGSAVCILTTQCIKVSEIPCRDRKPETDPHPARTALMTPKITLTDTPDDGMIKALAKKLTDFNKVGSGRPLDYRSLTIFLTDPDTGELLGGLWGAPTTRICTSN